MMRERPILFSTSMVRALLDGAKTQTRRVIREHSPYRIVDEREDGSPWLFWFDPNHGPEYHEAPSPYGTRGDRLWVRETFAPNYFDDGGAGYRADWTPDAANFCPEPRWKPSIFMPRTLSRITLEVIDIRVERLQHISTRDAMAEGVAAAGGAEASGWDPRETYRKLWDDINAKRPGCAWSSNPWVWVVEFGALEPSGAAVSIEVAS